MKIEDLKGAHTGEIILLTKNQCPQCDHMKRRLNRMGETYVEVSLENDSELLADVKARGAMSAPVMITPQGNLLTTNIVEMEKTLKQELTHPRHHHFYTQREMQEILYKHPEIDLPILEDRWETVEQYGYALGYVITENNFYTYSLEIGEYGVNIETSVYDNPPRRFPHVSYPHIVGENDTIISRVENEATTLVTEYIDSYAKDALEEIGVPYLETPREITINISNGRWKPAVSNPADEMFFEGLSHAAAYKWSDFQKLSEDDYGLYKLTELFDVTVPPSMDMLKELPHPKAVSDLAGAAKGVEVVKAQHPEHSPRIPHMRAIGVAQPLSYIPVPNEIKPPTL